MAAYSGHMKPAGARARRHLPTSPFRNPAAPAVTEFAVDDRVTHDRYGMGRVVGVEAEAVLVNFGSRQERIVAPYRRMSLL